MGEQRAVLESIFDNQADCTYFWMANDLSINYVGCLHSFNTNKLIYVHKPHLAVTSQIYLYP
jgi:hypothetical protein